ncbi:FAD/NAD(P)-binding domain-containing protein, partial [Pseudovirgaria hyperparasitica]
MPTFTIIIVGAGLAGLCSAIGLLKQGHKVIILERAHKLSPAGAGIHVPPNATLVLERWGILERFRHVAIVPASFTFRRYDDGRLLGRTAPEGSETASRTPYWSMKRADYQSILHDIATELGCDLRLNQHIVSVNEDEPSVTTSTGELIKGDLIIATDGMKSHLRTLILPNNNTSPTTHPQTTYRAWAPISTLTTNP